MIRLYIYEDYYKLVSLYNDDNMSCNNKASRAGFSITLNQNLLTMSEGADYTRLIYNNYNTNTNTAEGYISFSSSSSSSSGSSSSSSSSSNTNNNNNNNENNIPIYAFFAVGNCNTSLTTCISNCNGPIIADISLTFTNGYPSHNNYKYLPYDEVNSLTLVIVMFVIQGVILLFTIQTRRALFKLQKLHPTFRLLILSVFLTFSSLFFYILYFSILGSLGYIYIGRTSTTATITFTTTCTTITITTTTTATTTTTILNDITNATTTPTSTI